MAEEQTEKIMYIVTHGPDTPELASLPFVLANAALAMDVEVTVLLQGTAVLLARKGMVEHVVAGGLAPLKDMFKDFFEFGGKMWICGPCIKHREITEGDLIDGAEVVAGGAVITEVLAANAVLNY